MWICRFFSGGIALRKKDKRCRLRVKHHESLRHLAIEMINKIRIRKEVANDLHDILYYTNMGNNNYIQHTLTVRIKIMEFNHT